MSTSSTWDRKRRRLALSTPEPPLFEEWLGEAISLRGGDAASALDDARSRISDERDAIEQSHRFESQHRERLNVLREKLDQDLIPEYELVVQSVRRWAETPADEEAEGLVRQELEHVLVGWRKQSEHHPEQFDVLVHPDELRALMKWALFRLVHQAATMPLSKKLARAWDQAVGEQWTHTLYRSLDSFQQRAEHLGLIEPAGRMLSESLIQGVSLDQANSFVRAHAGTLVSVINGKSSHLLNEHELLSITPEDLELFQGGEPVADEDAALDSLVDECERLWTGSWETLEGQFREGRWRCDGTDLRNYLLLGYRPDNFEAVTLSRKAVQEHVQILGSTGVGKTSLGVIPLLRQLLRGTDEGPGSEEPGAPPPMLVLDLKGDWELYRALEHEAHANGQRFRLFTTDPGMHSEVFDPMQHLAHCHGTPSQFAQDMGSALNMVYGEDYAHAFFGEANLWVLEESFEALGSNWTLDALVSQLKRRAARDKDYKGAHRTVGMLAKEPVRSRIVSDRAPGHDDTIWMERALREREVIYVYLPGRSMEMQSRRVGKLILNAFIGEAQRRHATTGQVTQAYVFADEFQNIAARNVGQMLTDVRSLGISMLMAHQGLYQLRIGAHTDIREAVQTNARVRMFFSVPTLDELQYIQGMSGETLEMLTSTMESNTEGRTKGEAKIEMRSRFRNAATSRGTTGGLSWGGSRYGPSHSEGSHEGSTDGRGRGESEGTSKQEGETSSETQGTKTQPMYRPGMASNEALLASSIEQHCIVLTRNKSDLVEVSPTGVARLEGGRPRVTKCIYTVGEDMHDRLKAAAPRRLERRSHPAPAVTEQPSPEIVAAFERALNDGRAFMDRVRAAREQELD